MNTKFEKLTYLFPDEDELTAWYDSLTETEQANIYHEYQQLVPDWLDHLRRIRHDMTKGFI